MMRVEIEVRMIEVAMIEVLEGFGTSATGSWWLDATRDAEESLVWC